MTTKTDIKKQENDAEIARLEALIKPLISFDETGKPALADKDVFKNNLPEGVTVEAITAYNNYTQQFIAGTVHALKDSAPEAFKNNPGLENFKLEVPMVGAHHAFSLNVQREREIRNPGTGETSTAPGFVTLKVDGGWSGKAFQDARQALRDAFTEANK